jgi:serine protease Do
MDIARFSLRVILHCAILVLAAPVLADMPKVKDAEVRTVIQLASGSKSQTVLLRQFKVALADGEPAGAAFTGRWCQPLGVLAWTTNNFGNLSPRAVKVFREELSKVGYTVAGDPNELFSDTSDIKADLEVGALVTDLVVTHCHESDGAALGGVFMKVKWEVYSPLAKQVVFQVITEGSSQNLDKADVYRPSDRLMNAFRLATDNLLAEQGFHDLLVASAQQQAATPSTEPRYELTRLPFVTGGVAKNVGALRSSVTTVYSAVGTGSGFFISTNGYLITNQHVVGDSKYVKIKLLTGRELVGEVLVTKRIRDVALIKTEPIEITALAVRDGDPNVGDDVYVLGSPFGEKFQGTLTKGVLSGYRELDGIRYLQSDVAVLPGNSGGPLIDNAGAVVGIARIGGGTQGGNLNLFIPIGEALNQLSVELK